MKNTNLISEIASYGVKYREEYLRNYDPSQIESDPLASLDFFFSRACFQGRRDTISSRVYDAVMYILNSHFQNADFHSVYMRLESTSWGSLHDQLEGLIGKGKVGKARDIEMVISTLKFISNLPNHNLVNYSAKRIMDGEIQSHFYELQPSHGGSGITQVGPKVASFYLRDLVSLFNIESYVPDKFVFILQPIDVWVRKVAKKLGISSDNKSDVDVRDAIVSVCTNSNVSTLHFNQGAWFLGYHSFDILLDLLADRAKDLPLISK